MDCIIITNHVLPGVWLNDDYDVVCVVLKSSRVFTCNISLLKEACKGFLQLMYVSGQY